MTRKMPAIVLIVAAIAAAAQGSFRGFLTQGSAVTIRYGQIVDGTDGKSAKTTLTIKKAHIYISKAGGVAGAKNEATAATHDRNGYYRIPLDATDTGTLGILQIAAEDANDVLLPTDEYQVIVGVPGDLATTLNGGIINVGSGQVQANLKTWDDNDLTKVSWSTTEHMPTVNLEYVREAAPISSAGVTTAVQTAISNMFTFDAGGWVNSHLKAADDNVEVDPNKADILAALSSSFAAVQAVLTKVDTMLQASGDNYQFTPDAVDQVSTVAIGAEDLADIADAVWNEIINTGHATRWSAAWVLRVLMGGI